MAYKVIFINGSPRHNGCTARAFEEMEKVFHANGIDTQRVEAGSQDLRGCISCLYCKTHNKCVFNDLVNDTAPIFAQADGVIVGTPVYYAGCNGQVHSFLDRLFFSTASTVDKTMKVGATIVSSRRGGSTSAFDDINKYFTISAMPIASSTYWNEVHGFTAEDVEKDLEGLQTMRNLAQNMTYMIKALKAYRNVEEIPIQERNVSTSFIDGK